MSSSVAALRNKRILGHSVVCFSPTQIKCFYQTKCCRYDCSASAVFEEHLLFYLSTDSISYREYGVAPQSDFDH